MTHQIATAVFVFMALLAIGIVSFAPFDFRFLWEAKAASFAFGGFALFLTDPKSVLGVLGAAFKPPVV